LSREQLRNCVAQQNQINSEAANLEKEGNALQVQQKELQRLEALIVQREPLANVYSQQSVDSFNALVENQRRLVDAYNAKLPAFNAKVARGQQIVDRFNAECAEHAYYESDMQVVLSGK
jgi:hypothetical protein